MFTLAPRIESISITFCQITYVRTEKVVPVCSGVAKRLLEGNPFNALKSTLEQHSRRERGKYTEHIARAMYYETRSTEAKGERG
jgi:hypothetical protein